MIFGRVPVAVLMKLEEGTGSRISKSALHNHGGTDGKQSIFNFLPHQQINERLTLFVDAQEQVLVLFLY